MSTGLENCLSYINCQMQARGDATITATTWRPRPAVTLSRQAGCGAREIAEKLARRLQERAPAGSPPWTVFDRNLMAKVLEDHHLPARLEKFLPEDRVTELQDILDELFGLHPPSWTVVQQTSETILQLAELGHVILIGRAANVITEKLEQVVHVRLVAPLERRLERVRETQGLSAAAARAFVEQEDRGRERYLKKYFQADINDPLLYHLTLNTDRVGCEEAARLIGEAVPQPLPKT